MLLDCFALERKHIAVKAAAQHTLNTIEFETSILSRSHLDQLRDLEGFSVDNALRGDRFTECAVLVGALGVERATVADSMEYDGVRFGVGDIVFLRNSAALIIACASAEGTLLAIVRPLGLVARSSATSSTWSRQPHLQAWGMQGVTHATCWTIDAEVIRILAH